jgi:hypothetical protein
MPARTGFEIDVSHARQDGALVLEALALESPLPETPATFVLLVGAARDWFVQAAHEPAQIGQACSADEQLPGIAAQDLDGDFFGRARLTRGRSFSRKQLQPAPGNFLRTPGADPVG